MPLDDVGIFVRIVEAGSLTAAARQLGASKSTLSRALARLEDVARVRLLRRSTRSLALTDAGRAFYERVGPHVSGLSEALAAFGDRGEELRGTLRVTAPIDLGESVLGDLVARFVRRHPQLRVELDLSNRPVNLLDEGFDIALRGAPRLAGGSLVARKIGRLEVQLFAAPAYLARRGTPRTVDDLAHHDCVQFRPGGRPSARPLLPEARPGTPRPTRIGCNEFLFARAALRAGAGIGPLMPVFAAGDVAAGLLVRVLPEWSRPWSSFYVVYPAARHLPKATAAFRDFVLEHFRQTKLFAP